MASNIFSKLHKVHLDYFIPIAIWLLIFTKNSFSSLMFVDYVPSAYFDSIKLLKLSVFTNILTPFDLFKLILSPLYLLSILFTLSILIAMLVSYFYIKRTFKEKPLIFSILFSLIYFFNPFVYSRIMIGQLGVLLAYLLIPIYLYYLFAFFKSSLDKKSLIKLAIAFTICSSFSIHFFALNFFIFLIASFWFYFYKNQDKHIRKYFLALILLIIILILLNSFWLQGFFSNKIFSAIDSSHESFFSPKMSKDIPAVGKILGMYGFWRENAYSTPYKELPYAITAIELSVLVLLMLFGYFILTSKESKLFYTLFWFGLILGTGISHPYTKPFFDFLFQNLVFFNGFRDSHKFVSLIALSYAYLIPISIIKLKSKIKPIYLALLTLLLILFILAYTYPLIGLKNQIKPINYPGSYYETNKYLETQDINGYVIYLPFQTYLTYSWSLNSSSDGRIAVPINQIIQKPVITGPDQYGAGDDLMNSISDCLSKKSIDCLEIQNIQYILNDKCAFFPDSYSWINNTSLYSTDCINVYKINPNNNIQETKTPLRFILGVLISLITLIILVYMLRRRE